ncbi:MAG: cadherin-like beta sandwich domain-containing protein [Clostridia bacterium]|nr:cadherin-like beta sandwich domain-containing protein [Clostridia bacterium]
MKKLITVLLLTILAVTQFLPICTHASSAQISLENLSGVVYPGSTLTLGITVTAKGVMAMTFPAEIGAEEELLTMTTEPTAGISDWELTKGSALYMLSAPAMAADGINVEQTALVTFSFKVSEEAQIGDKIEIALEDVVVVHDYVATDELPKKTTEDLVYTATVVERPKNTDNSLSALSVAEGVLVPEFDASNDQNEYTMTVPNSIEALTVSAQTADELATLSIEGTTSLVVGENTVTVTVTAENGDERVYTILVTRKEPPSTDTALKDLQIAEGTLTPVFDASITEYSITVPSDVTALTLTAQPLDDHASFVVAGNENFAVGKNTVTITVTAEDGLNTAVYTLTVTRERPVETSSLLTDLYITDRPFDTPFDATLEKQSYTVRLPYEIDTLPALSVVCESPYATYQVSAPKALTVGENTVVVTVTSEDTLSTSVYTLTVVRLARVLSSDATLKSLQIDDGVLSPAFSPENTVYTVITTANLRTLAVSALANDSAASVRESTIVELVPAESKTCEIVCTAEDGSKRTYILNIYTPKKEMHLLLNGAPIVGEKLTLTLTGESDGGSYTWFIGGKEVTGVTGDSYTLLSSDENKTVKAVFTDKYGNTYETQTHTVVSKSVMQTPDSTVSVGEIILVIACIIVSLAVGFVLGMFIFKKKRPKSA